MADTKAAPSRYPRFVHQLGCGHERTLGIAQVERHPAGQVWCNKCAAYSPTVAYAPSERASCTVAVKPDVFAWLVDERDS